MKPLLTITLFLLTLSLHAGTTVYSAPDESGLMGYYKYDESGTKFIDYSGNGGSATNVGGATLIPGVVGSAANFNGVNQSSSNSLPSSVSGITNYTFCGWFYLFNPAINGYIFHTQIGSLGSDNYSEDNFYQSGTNYIFFSASQFSGHASTGSLIQFPCAMSNWVFLAEVVSGVTRTVYTNAVMVVTTNTTYGIPFPTNYFAVAKQFNGTGVLKCSADEVRIYNRALSATEIATLYNFRQTTCLTNGTTPFKP